MENTFIIAKSICEDSRLKERLMEEFSLDHQHFADPKLCRDIDYLKNQFPKAQAFVVGHQIINMEFLKNWPDLKFISKYGVGLDNIDFEDCHAQKVAVLTSEGVNKNYVAELTLGLILGLLRRISISHRELQSGNWRRDGGTSLFGKKLGIIGFGNIGQALAKLVQPFGVQILVHDILDKSQEAQLLNARQVSLSDLIHESDLVSIHVPLTDKTRHLCDRNFFEKMNTNSYFINTARGRITDLNALMDILGKNGIAGAACDVFPEEPIGPHPILKMKNFVATPHIAANCMEAKEVMARSALQRIHNQFLQ